MHWIDALLNASMILAGMGPVNPIESTGGKLFATFYCLFSGIVFLTMMAIMLAPAYHRFMHRFHLEDETSGSDKYGATRAELADQRSPEPLPRSSSRAWRFLR